MAWNSFHINSNEVEIALSIIKKFGNYTFVKRDVDNPFPALNKHNNSDFDLPRVISLSQKQSEWISLRQSNSYDWIDLALELSQKLKCIVITTNAEKHGGHFEISVYKTGKLIRRIVEIQNEEESISESFGRKFKFESELNSIWGWDNLQRFADNFELILEEDNPNADFTLLSTVEINIGFNDKNTIIGSQNTEYNINFWTILPKILLGIYVIYRIWLYVK